MSVKDFVKFGRKVVAVGRNYRYANCTFAPCTMYYYVSMQGPCCRAWQPCTYRAPPLSETKLLFSGGGEIDCGE